MTKSCKSEPKKKMLQELQLLCEELNTTNKTNAKKEIIKDKVTNNENLKKLLLYIHDKNFIFHITSANLKKFKKNGKMTQMNQNENIASSWTIFDILDKLRFGDWTGNKALCNVSCFIQENAEFEELIYNIIDKNLKIRLSIKILQQLFPNEFKSFYVALANNYKESLIKNHNDQEEWFISRKLDGIRCLCIINVCNKSVDLYSRNGKPFSTLSLLQEEILKNIEKFSCNCVLDGEIIDNFNHENFKTMMEQISKKNFTMSSFEFCIFDYIPFPDFETGVSKLLFTERLHVLNTIFSDKDSWKYCQVLPQTKYSETVKQKWIEDVDKYQWEGFMIRKNTIWEGKRTNNLLKYKKMNDEEFKVISLEFGPFRIIDKMTKLEKEIQCLSSVVIDFHNTKVGSGFSLEERINYFENPKLLLHKMITVQYFEKTPKSLRFPVFKCIRKEE